MVLRLKIQLRISVIEFVNWEFLNKINHMIQLMYVIIYINKCLIKRLKRFLSTLALIN